MRFYFGGLCGLLPLNEHKVVSLGTEKELIKHGIKYQNERDIPTEY